VEIKLYHGHTGPIKTCQLIENKNWILTGSNDNTARLWDLNNGREIHKYKLNHNMAAVSAVRINQDATQYNQ
jgi:WD40 repeat protein